mmetsp:Transcript_4416/g.8141  ORF Transcript_4416/g.8141 Transcript_4416/m.8141 type:complete len:80 (-) Transcript_4416:621-860(-)
MSKQAFLMYNTVILLQDLDLETTRTTTTTSTFEFTSIGSHIRLDTIVSVRIADRRAMSKVCESLSGSWSTKQDRSSSLG